LTFFSSPTKAQSADKIRFAYQDRIGSVLPIVAVNKGYFADQGLMIKPLRFSSGPASVEALYSGSADIGAMGDTAAIILITRDPRFVIFASHVTGEDRHRLMIRQDAPLKSLNDLKGKRLAVKKGTSTYGGLLAALDRANIDPTTIDIIDLPPHTMITALHAGAIDAFAASEPTPSTAEENGARQLLTFGDLGNIYPIVLLARREFLEQQASSVEHFIKAMTKAQEYVASNPNEVTTLISAETGLSLSSTRAAMLRHQYHLRLDSEIISSLKRTTNFLHDQKIIKTTPDWAKAVDGSFIK
jgi:sulfonate transport system substrate-binding protein